MDERFVDSCPTSQSLVDIFSGEWVSQFPPKFNVNAGPLPFFEDPRILWAEKQMGGFKDRSVMEVGPLEGHHTWLINKFDPRELVAIEGNRRHYMKCLISKEIMGMTRPRFLLGNCMKYLEESGRCFDIGIASGILYHLRTPLEFLERMCHYCDRLFIWTHYFDQVLVEQKGIEHKFQGSIQLSHAGFNTDAVVYRYGDVQQDDAFCGGLDDTVHWLSRNAIIGALKHYGHRVNDEFLENQDNVNGPAFSLVSERS